MYAIIARSNVHVRTIRQRPVRPFHASVNLVLHHLRHPDRQQYSTSPACWLAAFSSGGMRTPLFIYAQTHTHHILDMIAIIGTSDQPCWLAEACKILLLLLLKKLVYYHTIIQVPYVP